MRPRWKENGQGVGCCGSFDTDADRVARREPSPVTTTCHAIPSAMSILDTGELANVFHESPLRQMEDSYELPPSD